MTHPLLIEWNQKSNLLQVIKAIHESFNSDPPKLAKQVEAKQVEEKKGTLIQKPDISKVLWDIEKYGEDELWTLNEDDDFFYDFFNNLDGVKELSTNFAKILDGLKS